MVPWHQCHRTATYQPVPATGRCCCRPHKPVLSRCTLGQQGAAQRRPGPRLVLPPVDFYLPPVTDQDQCGSLGGVSPVIVIADVLQ